MGRLIGQGIGGFCALSGMKAPAPGESGRSTQVWARAAPFAARFRGARGQRHRGRYMPNAELRPYASPWGHCVASPAGREAASCDSSTGVSGSRWRGRGARAVCIVNGLGLVANPPLPPAMPACGTACEAATRVAPPPDGRDATVPPRIRGLCIEAWAAVAGAGPGLARHGGGTPPRMSPARAGS